MSSAPSRSCRGKVRYPSWAVAERVRREIGDAGIGVYECRFCGGGYHLGHERSRAADRITQLLEAAGAGRVPA